MLERHAASPPPAVARRRREQQVGRRRAAAAPRPVSRTSRRRQTEVDPAALGTDRRGDDVDERRDVVTRDALALEDRLDRERRSFADRARPPPAGSCRARPMPRPRGSRSPASSRAGPRPTRRPPSRAGCSAGSKLEALRQVVLEPPQRRLHLGVADRRRSRRRGSAAFTAASTPTVATGTPMGICAVIAERLVAHHLRRGRDRHADHGQDRSARRSAAARCPDMPVEQITTLRPRSKAVRAYSSTRSGLRGGRHDPDLVRDAELLQDQAGLAHDRQLGRGRGQHPDLRCLVAHRRLLLRAASAAMSGPVLHPVERDALRAPRTHVRGRRRAWGRARSPPAPGRRR